MKKKDTNHLPVVGQEELMTNLDRIFSIYKTSEAVIRPHFILTGASGSGKTLIIQTLCMLHELDFFEISASQLTKEGTSGNSLSKALVPLKGKGGKLVVCFVDEWDKLFISSNSNDSLAHEVTAGVQNEFLKVLESTHTSVFGDYGHYIPVPCNKVLFIFAGAFNNEPNVSIDRLRDFGVKTEFLGRVGLIFNTEILTLEQLYKIVDESTLLDHYCELFEDTDREKVTHLLKAYIRDNYEFNMLGARMVNTLVHQYFIKGSLSKAEVKNIVFNKKLKFK